jgi:hypothetical protein
MSRSKYASSAVRQHSSIYGVQRAHGFDQEQMDLLGGARDVLYTLGHNVDRARSQGHDLVSHKNLEGALQNKKEVIGRLMLMPREGAPYLESHVVIDFRNRSRSPPRASPSPIKLIQYPVKCANAFS